MGNKKTKKISTNKKHTKTRKTNKKGGALCSYNNDPNDIYTLGKHYITATNDIYETMDNPNILIKKIQHPKINIREFDDYTIQNIKKEMEIAQFCSDIEISPHVYYTTLCIDEQNIIGYIVMDKIHGKIIDSKKKLNKHLDKIYAILDTLKTSGIVYKDYNINNFIVENKTNNVYIIDFGDAYKITLFEIIHGANFMIDNKEIKRNLLGSINIHKKYKK